MQLFGRFFVRTASLIVNEERMILIGFAHGKAIDLALKIERTIARADLEHEGNFRIDMLAGEEALAEIACEPALRCFIQALFLQLR